MLHDCNTYEASRNFSLSSNTPWITLDLGTWGILKSEYFVG